MLVDVYKNRNTASKTYGQFYGRVFNRETLSLKGFAKHMTEHGKRLSEEELVLFLKQVVSCLKELIVQGQPVKFDGLGTFYPSLSPFRSLKQAVTMVTEFTENTEVTEI